MSSTVGLMSLRRRREQNDTVESGVTLRSTLGDDNTIPKQIQFQSEQTVPIQTNVYSLTLTKQTEIHQYEITLVPEILNQKIVNHFVYSALCPDGGPMGANPKWLKIIYDGNKVLYSTLPDLDGSYPLTQRDGKEVIVIVKQTKKISSDSAESLLQIYNTAFHKAYRTLGLENFRRKWLNKNDYAKTGSFNITKGILPSISYLSSGLAYIIDVATRIERKGTLYDLLKEGVSNPSRRRHLEEALRSIQIQTAHRPKPKSVNVSNVLWDEKVHESSFDFIDRKTGVKKTITIAQYYQEVYNHNCPPDDIIVEQISKRKNEKFVDKFPSSVLKAMGITDAERSNGSIMKEIAAHTKIPSDRRKQKLDEFVKQLKEDSNSSKFFEQWGLLIGNNIKTHGKIIRSPQLTFSDKNKDGEFKDITLNDRYSYQQELRNISLVSSPEYNGPCLFIGVDDIDRVLDEIKSVSFGLKFKLPKIEKIQINNSHPNDYCNEVINYINERETPCFVVCILPDSSKDRYDGIKRLLTVQLGIPSQCVVPGPKYNKSVATNIAIQIASKTGGVLCHVSTNILPIRNTMLIGLSMTSSKGSPAVCAATATTDRRMTQFYSDSTNTSGHEKVISKDFLEEFLTNSLEKWKEYNGEYPKRIVVYREGVSYGQMPRLKKEEVETIKDLLIEIDSNISLAYIIAQKRSSIRIMKGEHNLDNALPGTVVTDEISTHGVAEFYLISHYANQGSASPTRYTIIHQTPDIWKDDQLIKLTHYMTLQYPNWSGSIRIPACLMLASRLAEMSKSHLESQPAADHLKNFLHYL